MVFRWRLRETGWRRFENLDDKIKWTLVLLIAHERFTVKCRTKVSRVYIKRPEKVQTMGSTKSFRRGDNHWALNTCITHRFSPTMTLPKESNEAKMRATHRMNASWGFRRDCCNNEPRNWQKARREIPSTSVNHVGSCPFDDHCGCESYHTSTNDESMLLVQKQFATFFHFKIRSQSGCVSDWLKG